MEKDRPNALGEEVELPVATEWSAKGRLGFSGRSVGMSLLRKLAKALGDQSQWEESKYHVEGFGREPWTRASSQVSTLGGLSERYCSGEDSVAMRGVAATVSWRFVVTAATCRKDSLWQPACVSSSYGKGTHIT